MTRRSRSRASVESMRLENAAKAMVAAADERQSVLDVMQQHCPEVCDQIDRDARTPGLFSFWGRCVNNDEHVKETIVHPAILEAIGKRAEMPMQGRIVHSGLQHTYGYLFSLIETPYGTKRDRWVSPTITQGFGLERSLLSQAPKEGTLLANLTWFLGWMVYGTDPFYENWLNRLTDVVAGELLDYDYGGLSVKRVTEQVILSGKREREVLILTDFVTFPYDSGASENTLLIYSIQNGSSVPIKLITAFPVTRGVARDIEKAIPQRHQGVVRLHYNAYVPGMNGQAVRGRRFLSKRFLGT